MEAAGRKDCHNLPGASGEIGCRQMIPATWKARALETLGYVPERTPINEEYVNVAWIERRLDQGYSPKEIGLLQNQGSTGPCRKGINRHGVAYDSCSYAQKFVALLNR